MKRNFDYLSLPRSLASQPSLLRQSWVFSVHMSVLGIVANPIQKSLSHAALRSCLDCIIGNGCSTNLADLYEDGFNPVLTSEEIQSRFSFDAQVLKYQRQLQRCTGLLLSYPDWWGMPPAILKGWLDRVLRPGVAFDYEGDEFEAKRRVPLLTGCPGLIITAGDDISCEKEKSIRILWEEIFDLSGISPYKIEILGDLKNAGKNERTAWIDHVTQTAGSLFTQNE